MKMAPMTSLKRPGKVGANESTFSVHLHTTVISELELLRLYLIPAHVLDDKGIILYVNRRELEILGYGAHEYVGKHFYEFLCTGCGYFPPSFCFLF